MKAMIFAAGMGTRLRPLTDSCPKALVKVEGHTLLDIQLDRLSQLGVDEVIVNVHHFGEQIIDHLRNVSYKGMRISISDERALLLDTGGGLRKAAEQMFANRQPQRLLIHNVDILENADLGILYNARPDADAVLLVSQRQTKRYLLFDDDMSLVGWTNISTGEVKSPYSGLNPKDYHMLAFSGLHVVGPRVYTEMKSWPDVFPIIDFYIRSCSKLKIVGVEQAGLCLLDVGKPETLAEAPAFLKSIS